MPLSGRPPFVRHPKARPSLLPDADEVPMMRRQRPGGRALHVADVPQPRGLAFVDPHGGGFAPHLRWGQTGSMGHLEALDRRDLAPLVREPRCFLLRGPPTTE